MNSYKIFIRNLTVLILVVLLTACSSERRALYDIPDKEPPPRKIENVKVALVLGGGGAKGIAHLGVLSVFEENNIPIDLIVGTSAGSIVGAMYASYGDVGKCYKAMAHVNKWDLLDLSIGDSFNFFSDLIGPVQGYYLEKYIVERIPEYNIEDLRIPFIAVATDVVHEKAVTFSSGPVALGVRASSALPPLFTPVMVYGRLLVDGGVVQPVPVDIARRYNPKLVIAVDISTSGRNDPLDNMMDLTYRSLNLSYYRLSKTESRKADIVIKPDMDGFGMFEDVNKRDMYMRGKEAALAKLPLIMELLHKKGIKLNSRSY